MKLRCTSSCVVPGTINLKRAPGAKPVRTWSTPYKMQFAPFCRYAWSTGLQDTTLVEPTIAADVCGLRQCIIPGTTLNLNLRDHSYSCYYTGSPNIFVQIITILLYQVPGIYSHTYWSCRIRPQQTNETYATSQQVRKYKWLNPSCPIHTYEAGKTILPGVSLGLRLAGGCPCSLFVPL